MTRQEKIKFIIDAVYEIEGVKIGPRRLAQLTDEELDKELDWYDYLMDK